MAERLKLHRGGQLIHTPWEQETENPEEFVTVDVSAQAALYLMEPVTFNEELRLIDVFALFRKNETLQYIFSRDLAKEFLSAAFRLEAAPSLAPHNPEALEYLVLYREWARDTAANAMRNTDQLKFGGMSFVLKEDNTNYWPNTVKAGTRMQYSISLRPIKELLNLPLRYISETVILEDNEDADIDKYWKEIDRVTVEPPTLGQILQGILSEISCHGAPEDAREMHDEVMRLASEARRTRE